MIYELAVVARADLNEDSLAKVKQTVHDVVKAHEGEVLIEDDWGSLNLAQPTREGLKQGHYFYYIFNANNANNVELARRFRISEDVVRHMVINLGEESDREAIVKAYRTPFSKTYRGSALDDSKGDKEGDNPRKFARRKDCYFRAHQIKADWKDPATYSWLINEFGKISPARVSGVSRKHQRFATTAIKRARQVGISSYVSGRISELRS
jgi:small subunit ribosomal protein S6